MCLFSRIKKKQNKKTTKFLSFMINKHNQHRNHKVNLEHVLRNRNNLIKTTERQKLREYKKHIKTNRQIDK